MPFRAPVLPFLAGLSAFQQPAKLLSGFDKAAKFIAHTWSETQFPARGN
jgi:hypothetical protein